jgi:sigma-B regulation protein RsbU (phosphoserine phosphatase)
MTSETQAASLLREEVPNLIASSFFLFVGITAFLIAAVRRSRGVRILIWIGLWSVMYAGGDLTRSTVLRSMLPLAFDPARQLLIVCLRYLLIIPAVLAFMELTIGALRRVLQVLLAAGLTMALAAISWFLISGSQSTFLVYNQSLGVPVLISLIVSLCVPKLSRRYLVLSQHWVLTVGTLVFCAEALWVNIARPLNHKVPHIYDTLGFAVLLLSLAYTALEMIVGNERRLLSIENELAVARALQFSILPSAAPEIPGLGIAATYEPMTAVAGDFYEFLPVDEHRVGFLIADVSGHGVPAALIASMIKVATQTVNDCAGDPAEVLNRLGSILNHNLRGQFVSAAYLWIDTEAGLARYSAAGHPPLICWHSLDATLHRIESNGLLFGLDPGGEYPVREIPLRPGDRFLLYTDGVTEPENEAGEQFGDHRLERVMRDNRSRTVSELSERLMAEIRAWKSRGVTQHDDITLIAIDILAAPVPSLDSSDTSACRAITIST